MSAGGEMEISPPAQGSIRGYHISRGNVELRSDGDHSINLTNTG